MIGIIDYRMGNLRSVQKSLEHVGAQVEVYADGQALAKANPDKIILPGVGAFTDGMHYLDALGFVDPIREHIAKKKWFLGICLGMQLLFSSSQESVQQTGRSTKGLGLLDGEVVRFQENQGEGKPRLKVPQMGWNRLSFEKPCPMFDQLNEKDAYVYFVHGYYCKPEDETCIASRAEYGQAFCAAIMRENVLATQFHPEKSQRVGLQILKNFAQLA